MAKIVVQVGRGRVGQKEKRELAHLIIAPLHIFLSIESNEQKGDISFIMKDPPEFRFTMFLSFYREGVLVPLTVIS